MAIWHIFIAFSAFSWLSGVTPAQQSARTKTGVSGSLAFRIIAFEMTQMSVHSPINSTDSSSGTRAICSASSNEPNTGLSMIVESPVSSRASICQPSVP